MTLCLTVHFEEYPVFNQSWEVLSDSIDVEKDVYAIDLVNDELYWVYQNIFDMLNNENIYPFTSKAFFRESDFIFEEYPEEQVKNQFVFLKPGEFYTDTINLIGFLLIGGNYTFKVKSDILKNYVLGESIQNTKKEFEETRIPLPPI